MQPRRRSATVVMTGLLLLVGPAATAAQPGADEVSVPDLTAAVTDEMAASGIPGYAVTVVSEDDVVLAEAFGDAGEGRPVTVDMPFVIGSTSKSFTALAVMQLVDEGAVDLDAPVVEYVPELELKDGAEAGITVRHLLNQTSGLPEVAGGPVMKSARDGTALAAVAELADTAVAGPPGEEFRYSNANYVLAGLVVERASGESYPTYIERHIFEPLGMEHSYTSLAAARADGVATGHRYWFGAAVASGPTVRPGLLAAGYLISSVSDLGRYLAVYLNDGRGPGGEQIVSSTSLATMLEPVAEATLGPWADAAPARYAMGWFVGGPWDEPALLHPGNAPDSSAMIVLLPDRGWAVAGTANATSELPGAPSVIDRLSRTAVDVVVGEEPTTGPSLRSFYLVFDAVVLLLVAAAAWGLVRAVQALRRLERPRRRWLAGVGVAVRLAGAVLLLLIPVVVGYGWRAAWVWIPDLTLVLGVLAALLTTTAALRGVLLSAARSQASTETPTPPRVVAP